MCRGYHPILQAPRWWQWSSSTHERALECAPVALPLPLVHNHECNCLDCYECDWKPSTPAVGVDRGELAHDSTNSCMYTMEGGRTLTACIQLIFVELSSLQWILWNLYTAYGFVNKLYYVPQQSTWLSDTDIAKCTWSKHEGSIACKVIYQK